MRGDWNTERSSLDSAIETLRAGQSRFVVWALAEAVTGAWLAGDEHARLRYAGALREAVERYHAVGFVYFGAMPSREQKPTGTESPRWLALAHLSSVCAAETWGAGSRFCNPCFGGGYRCGGAISPGSRPSRVRGVRRERAARTLSACAAREP